MRKEIKVYPNQALTLTTIQKRFYTREMIDLLNYEIQQISFIPPSLLCNLNNKPFCKFKNLNQS